MGNRFFVILAACAVLFVGLLVFNKKDEGATTTTVSPSNHITGKSETGVTLVEYGDFECPGCGRFYPVLKQVKDKYGDKISFQFRNFPLTQIHQNAMAAHRAAEAAEKQGKFWEMHDLLYQSQATWEGRATNNPNATFENFARELGLDVEKFKTDSASSAINDIIQADIRAGNDLRVSSTPTFFLNGTKLEDARDTLEYFSEKIDALIAEKN